MSRPSETSPRVPETHSQAEYSPQERKLLLQVAHNAILSSLEGREFSESSYSPHLSEPRGAFTTLYCQGKLRGCVGYPMPSLPLFHLVGGLDPLEAADLAIKIMASLDGSAPPPRPRL